MKSLSKDTGDVESSLDDVGIRGGSHAARRVAALRKDRDRRTHLHSEVKVVYAGDCLAVIEDRIQLFRTQ